VQLGYSDENGNVPEWTAYTLKQCHTLTVDEAPNLRMIYPRFLDERINPDGGIDYEVLLLTQPGIVALFLADPRIMYGFQWPANCGQPGDPVDPAAPPVEDVKK